MKIKLQILFFVGAAVLASAPLVRADEASSPPGPQPSVHEHRDGKRMFERRLKMLDEKLCLDADQKTKIQGFFESAMQQIKTLRQDDSLPPEDRHAKMLEIMTSTHEQVRVVLTPDQQKIFDALPPDGPGHRGPPPPDRANNS